MTPIDELEALLTGPSRVVVIAERDVDLRKSDGNTLFVLKMMEGSLAAGGRGGGFGERRIVHVSLFKEVESGWEKRFETDEEAKLSSFEVPYYVTRMPFVLSNGTEGMGYGVVDPELVRDFISKTG